MEAAAIASLFVFGGLLTYTICERRHQRRWWMIDARVAEDDRGPYRVDGGPILMQRVLIRRRAPALIRRTALWSIYMGQMAVPGALLGLIGMFAAGLGLVSIPGLALAIRIWRLGYALLRRDPEAVAEARQLVPFAIWLNVVTLLVGGVALLLGAWGLTLVLWPYGLVSLAHAEAMRRCAELLELELGGATVAKPAVPEPVVDGSAGGVMRLGGAPQTM